MKNDTVLDRLFLVVAEMREKQPNVGHTVVWYAHRLDCSISAVHQAFKELRSLFAKEGPQYTLIRERVKGEHIYRFAVDLNDASSYIGDRVNLSLSHVRGARDIVAPFARGDRSSIDVQKAVILERSCTRAIEDIEVIELQAFFA